MLGILPERGLLGGRKPLSLDLARQAIDTQIAKPLGLSVEEAAAAIYAVQNAQTGDLLRKTVVEAGHDPRDFVLYAFGGAGPGALRPLRRRGRGQRGRGPARARWRRRSRPSGWRPRTSCWRPSCRTRHVVPFDPARAEQQLRRRWSSGPRAGCDRQGVRFATVELHREIDMRYTMQLAEVTAPVAGGPLDTAAIEAAAAAFEQRYAALYGADAGFREAGIQAITFRVRGIGVLPFSPALPEIPAAASPDPAAAQTGSRPVCLDAAQGFVDTPVYDYRAAAGRARAHRPGDRRGADHDRGRPRRHHRHRGRLGNLDHPLRRARRLTVIARSAS